MTVASFSAEPRRLTGPPVSSIEFQEMAVAGNRLFFTARTPEHGSELWVSDGMKDGTHLLRDIMPGVRSSMDLFHEFCSTPWLAAVGDQVFFSAADAEHGLTLWISDGTEAGTRLVRDIHGEPLFAPGWGRHHSPKRAVDRLFFVASDQRTGVGLFVSDGSEAGTRLVMQGHPGGDGITLDSRLFVAKADGLWVTDGSEEGTRRLLPDTHADSFARFADRVFFVVREPSLSGGLWATDGTSAGTQLVAGNFGDRYWLDDLTAAGDRIFFTVEHSQLWSSDGQDTQLVTRISSLWGLMGAARGRLFFSSVSDDRDLWVSDGTETGTRPIHEIDVPDWEHAVFGERLYFVGRDQEHGDELWVSNGTESGTKLVLDISRGEASGSPLMFAMGDNRLFFTAVDPPNGRQLWVLDLENAGEPPPFHRGDPNSSGTTDISDAVAIFGFLFLDGPSTLSCRESADANNDGTIDISDGIYLLSWLFTGGPEPAAPGPTGRPCGVDPDETGSAGDLGCVEYPPCP